MPRNAHLIPIATTGATPGVIVTGPSGTPAAWNPVEPRPRLGATYLLILAVVLASLFGLGGWAAVAPLKTAIVASGVLGVETHRKTVQHLYGGTIRTLLIGEGSAVEAGQPLIELDDTQTRTVTQALRAQQRAALAQAARLRSELEGLPAVRFQPDPLEPADDPEGAEIRRRQTDLFTARREAVAGQIAILRAQIAQTESEIRAMEEEAQATRIQLGLINEETKVVKELLEKGMERRPRYLALQRSAADLQGEHGRLLGSVARARQTIAALELQIIDVGNRHRSDAATELANVEREIKDLTERLVGAEDLVRQNVVRAPQSGVVVNLQVFTQGGVVRPGEPILEIVPQQDNMLVDVHILPSDIDAVRVGLEAEVELTAYKAKKVPPIAATLIQVSADRLTDPRTGDGYYTARLRLDAGMVKRLEGIELYPGMPADAMIVTGERTVLDYLVSPITAGMRRAFREE